MNTDCSAFKFPTNLYQLIEETFKIYEERKAIGNNCNDDNGGDSLMIDNNSYANCKILL